MTDHISTEEAERIADELAAGWDSERLRGAACVALRSLAAERDELIGERASADKLLKRVHERLGGGIDLETFADGTIEARWRRIYDGEISDERFATDPSLVTVLGEILSYEDQADTEAAALGEDQP